MSTEKKTGLRRGITIALRVAAALVGAVVLYLAVILAEPVEKKAASTATAPLSGVMETVTATDASQLEALYQAFGAPALRLRSGNYSLQMAECRDAAYGSGTARILQICYGAENGGVYLVSVRPADAISLLTPENMTLSTDLSHALAGMSAVLFTGSDGSRRLYARGQSAAYLLCGEGLTDEAFQSINAHITLTNQEDSQ